MSARDPRVEDAAFMAAHGETRTGAAKRLGIHAHTLRDYLKDVGRSDVWNRLGANT